MKEQNNYFKKKQEVVYNKILVSKNVLKNKEYKPSYRTEIISEDQIIDHHTISSNEIIFDFDFKNYMLIYKHAKLLITSLQERRIPYYIYSTGGKGIHIHIYFNKIEITNEEIKKLFTEALQYNFTWCNLRQFIFNLLIEESGISKNYVGKYIDTKKVNFNDLEEPTVLIRACGGRNQRLDEITGETTTSYKTWLSDNDFINTRIQVKNIVNVKYPEEITGFSINQNELGECLKTYIENAKNNKLQILEKVNLPNGYTGLSSVQKIIEGLEEGKRNEGAKVLALALVLDNRSQSKAEIILEQYANNCSQIGHPFTKNEAIGWYNWMKYQPAHFWNNEYVKKLGVWDKDTDDYYTLFKKDAIKILGNKTLLDKIDNYLKKEIVGEKDTRILIFLLLLSSKFKVSKEWNVIGDPKPQSVILSSLSASGKSYITKTILKLFGDDGADYYAFSRMTGAVLNYFTDIDMTNKILFVEELQGLDKESNQLRLWISEGKLKLATVEKVEEGEETKNRLVIKESIGQPVFITGTAEDAIDEQMNNRSWLISLDISEEQNKAILEYESTVVNKQNTSNTDELRLIKDALKELKSYHYIIPFFDYQLLNIPTNDVRIRRDYKKFGDLICCITLLFQKQRMIIKDDKGNEYLISSLDDYEIAVKYSEKVLSSTFSGLTVQQIWLLDQIRNQVWNAEFESSDIQRLTNWSQSKSYTILSQLEEVGAITSTGKKSGAPTIYALNAKKKLVNLTLPSREELLKKLEKNGSYFDFLANYDFYHSNMSKTGVMSEIAIDSFRKAIPKAIPTHGEGNFEVFVPIYNEQNPVKIDSIRAFEKKLALGNSFADSNTNIINTISPYIQMKSNIMKFIQESTKHMIEEIEIVKEFGEESYTIIDELCKIGELYKPRNGYIMKL